MTESPLARFLLTDPRDVGCDEAWQAIHVYAELVAAGGDPEVRFPGIAVHLASCSTCGDDFQGLLLSLRAGSSGSTSGAEGLTDY